MSDSTDTAVPAERRPPVISVGVIGWLRRNLFNSVWNSLLTIFAIYAIISVIPPMVDWVLTSAVWGEADPQTCKEATGACWAFIDEKLRLIVFGRYPFDEQWRPLASVVILIALFGVSTNRNFWRAWLGGVWLIGLAAVSALMWGGFLGMTFAQTTLWGGLPLTLILSVVGVVFAFPLSIMLALGRRSNMPVIRLSCVVYIELIRGVPLISLLFMASFMLPLFMPSGFSVDALLRAQIAVIMFTAAYLAEVIRGGLQAIPKGQFEAADSMGLTYWQTTRKIILPQAIRLVIPPIVNTFIGMFKDTTLVAIVSITDLLFAVRLAFADPEWRQFFIEGYIFVAAIFFIFCFSMSKYSQYLEGQLFTGHKR